MDVGVSSANFVRFEIMVSHPQGSQRSAFGFWWITNLETGALRLRMTLETGDNRQWPTRAWIRQYSASKESMNPLPKC